MGAPADLFRLPCRMLARLPRRGPQSSHSHAPRPGGFCFCSGAFAQRSNPPCRPETPIIPKKKRQLFGAAGRAEIRLIPQTPCPPTPRAVAALRRVSLGPPPVAAPEATNRLRKGSALAFHCPADYISESAAFPKGPPRRQLPTHRSHIFPL